MSCVRTRIFFLIADCLLMAAHTFLAEWHMAAFAIGFTLSLMNQTFKYTGGVTNKGEIF